MVSLHLRSVMVSQNSYCCSWSLEGSLQGKKVLVKYSYSWWNQSCTTWDVQNPVNNRINYQPQLVRWFSKTINRYRFHFCTTSSSFLKLEMFHDHFLKAKSESPTRSCWSKVLRLANDLHKIQCLKSNFRISVGPKNFGRHLPIGRGPVTFQIYVYIFFFFFAKLNMYIYI